MSEQSRLPGLPEPLPEGERLLWQGAPDWRALALRTFHGRLVAGYFAVLLAWVVVSSLYDGASVGRIAVALGWFGALALTTLGLIMLFAWLTARTTTYTITSRRVVLDYGIALTLTLNLPFKRVSAAGMKQFRDGTADLPLTMAEGDKLSYLMLWPHARPWRIGRPEPMLRAVPDGATVAAILVPALAAAHAQPAQAETGAKEAVKVRVPVATAAAA